MRGPLTVAAVKARLDDIAASRGDSEVAHSMEDALFADVLRAVADHHPLSAGIAAMALRSCALDFARWCG